MMEELIGMHICKKINLNECMVLNDEGLYQRVLSGIEKLEKKDIHRILTDTKLLKGYSKYNYIIHKFLYK